MSLIEDAQEAALYCKNDLTSNIVTEMPELEGVMGRYYALEHGMNPRSAQAIEEHYLPRFAGDKLPDSKAGVILAIADRADDLVAFFGMGKIPTGSKDPFALRRKALGLLRLLIEKKVFLDLRILFENAVALYPANSLKDNIDVILDFCMERLKSYLKDKGVHHSVFEKLLKTGNTNPLDFYEKALSLNKDFS